jgi:uncharacterized protein YciW
MSRSPGEASAAGATLPALPLPPERRSIEAMNAAAQKAVIAPRDEGGWPTAWRRAAAARIARLHGDEGLARAYLATIAGDADREIADPAFAGAPGREAAVLAFLDKVAARPRAVAAGDIAVLGHVGVPEADIVRLCELIAFLAYQCRVAATLALLDKAPT